MTSLKCTVCDGKGKKTSFCLTCNNSGIIPSHTGNPLGWWACWDCGNHRCLHCGGDCIEPRPRLELVT